MGEIKSIAIRMQEQHHLHGLRFRPIVEVDNRAYPRNDEEIILIVKLKKKH